MGGLREKFPTCKMKRALYRRPSVRLAPELAPEV